MSSKEYRIPIEKATKEELVEAVRRSQQDTIRDIVPAVERHIYFARADRFMKQLIDIAEELKAIPFSTDLDAKAVKARKRWLDLHLKYERTAKQLDRLQEH